LATGFLATLLLKNMTRIVKPSLVAERTNPVYETGRLDWVKLLLIINKVMKNIYRLLYV
jgi:hypothetical protein